MKKIKLFLGIGILSFSMTGCIFTPTPVVPPHEHTYSDSWSHDQTYHWHASTCGHDVVKDKEVHNFVSTTIEPTFENVGKVIYTCTVCEYSYEEPYGEVKEHTYESTWSYNEYGHFHKCSDPGYSNLYIDYEHHEFSPWVVDREATITVDGLRHHECSLCGYSEEEEIYSYQTLSDNFVYELNTDGVSYSVTNYKGTMPKILVVPSTYNNLPVTDIEYLGTDEGKTYKVILPESITSLLNTAFSGISGLICLKLPSSLQTIRYTATTNASLVYYLNSCNYKMEEIYNYSTIKVEDETKKIAIYDSESKSKLSFEDDSVYKTVVINSNSTQKYLLGYYGDDYKVAYTEKIDSISPFAFFKNNELLELSFKEVGTIGKYAFAVSKKLSKINIETVSGSIDELAFVEIGDNFKELHIGSSLYNEIVDGVMYSHDGEKVLYVLPDAIDVYISKEVTEMSYYAFTINHYNLKTVSFEEGTTIKDLPSFENCYSLTEIALPNILLKESHAFDFDNCYALKEIDISNYNVSFTFSYCHSLETIKISDETTSIVAGAFKFCESLESIDMPDCVKTIEENAFLGCSSLNLTCLPTSLRSIGVFAFGETAIESIKIPGGVSKLENYTFAYSKIKSIDLNKITQIGSNCFSYCSYLKEMNIPEGVTSVGTNAFLACSSLRKITLPSTLEIMNVDALVDCHKLATIDNKSSLDIGSKGLNIEYHITDDGFEYYQDGNDYVLTNYLGDKKEFTTPDFITIIGPAAFADYEHLNNVSKVTINEGVTEIRNYALYNDQIRELYLPSTLKIIGYGAIDSGNLTILEIPSSVEEANLVYTTTADYVINHSSVELPENINSYSSLEEANLTIDANGFVIETVGSSKKLVGYRGEDTEIVVPEGVNYISNTAFDNNYLYDISTYRRITKLTLPSTFNYIYREQYVGTLFDNMPYLEEIEVSTNNPKYKSIDGILYNKEGTELVRCPMNKEIELFETDEIVKKLSMSAFENCDRVKNIVIANPDTTLGDYTFSDNSGLESISLPAHLNTLPEFCLSGCHLETLEVPKTVETIESHALEGTIGTLIIHNNLKDLETNYSLGGTYGVVIYKGTTFQFDYFVDWGLFAVQDTVTIFCSDGTRVIKHGETY